MGCSRREKEVISSDSSLFVSLSSAPQAARPYLVVEAALAAQEREGV
jgi:hypothetical protein